MLTTLLICCALLLAGAALGNKNKTVPLNIRAIAKPLLKLSALPFKLARRHLWDTPKEVKGTAFAILLNLIIAASIVSLIVFIVRPLVVMVFLVPWFFVLSAWLAYTHKPKNKPRKIPGRKR